MSENKSLDDARASASWRRLEDLWAHLEAERERKEAQTCAPRRHLTSRFRLRVANRPGEDYDLEYARVHGAYAALAQANID